ncbi:hypothetical protein [Muriicola sp. Z0-33]|uniref:hypothetical protein n=1 Tax=Muriicola sp. Z0-33 TaxID=2816957 RepID=UPI0022390B8F|nr:hypothetical protein [Muriicola sp. Z0-33]MCW5515285.1 hypothetical protein [Muriicola sp. Z0-33]
MISKAVDSPLWVTNSRISQMLLLIMLIIGPLSVELCAQQLRSSFAIDTAKTQVFPYDLEFSLQLIGKKNTPIKHAYLFRLNNKEEVIFDRNTSLIKLGWLRSSNLDSLINLKIAKDSVSTIKRIQANKDIVSKWTRKSDSLKELSIEINKISSTQETTSELLKLKYQIKNNESKIKEYEEDVKYLKDISERTRFIKEKKNGAELLPPLEIINRNGDSVTVKIPPLRPNKRYLIVATNEAKKVAVLERLAKNYYSNEALDEIELFLIPKRNLPQNKSIKFIINPRHLRKDLDNSKEGLTKLFKSDSEEIQYTKLPPKLKHPGPFLPSHVIKDSSIVINPMVEGYLKINGLLSTLRNNGDLIIQGTYGISFDSIGRLSVNINKPTTSLSSRLNNIINTQQHISSSRQYLYFLTPEVDLNFHEYNNYFEEVNKVADQNKKKIEDKLKVRSDIDKYLNNINVPVGLQTNTVQNNTFNYQFVARNSRLIKPDFGLLYYFSDGFSGFAPYTGVHFDIRPTNEDVPFWQIKGWEKFLTVQLGVPLFAKELTKGERRKHLVGDTFSLYGGIGINLSHAIRIGYGAILFKSLDGNVNGDSTFKTNSAHTVSVGINLKLKSLFEGIYGSFKSIK